ARLPAAVQRDEIVERVFGQLVGVDVTEGFDGDSQLREVLGTMRAIGKVQLEPFPVPHRELTVEVGRHERDRVAAHECTVTSTPDPHHRSLPISTVNHSRNLARPRWRSTRWFPSVMPRSEVT